MQKNQHIDIDILDNNTLEKTNVEKPVQQGRVLLFNNFLVQQGAKLAYPTERKIL